MRWIGWTLAALFLVCALSVGAIVFTLPADRRAVESASRAEPAGEREQLLAALRPPKRPRPIIAVLAYNDGTETTDFLVPLGVLRASGVAQVLAVALRDEPVTLMPALRIRPDLDFADFDRQHPDGADFVIVPALHRSDDPAVSHWLAAQAHAGATVVGVCDGAWVLGSAGLLDDHTATAHWFSLGRLRKAYPTMTWAPDRRYVADRGVVTTTGVSASIPISLSLVEAIAGASRAQELARELGVTGFGAGHSSAEFRLDRGAAWTATRNLLAFWSWDSVDIAVGDGVDEVALALTADAYARTFRTSVRAVSSSADVTSKGGLHLLPDRIGAAGARVQEVTLPAAGAPAIQSALDGIGRRYGPSTADFVALQLEYDPAE